MFVTFEKYNSKQTLLRPIRALRHLVEVLNHPPSQTQAFPCARERTRNTQAFARTVPPGVTSLRSLPPRRAGKLTYSDKVRRYPIYKVVMVVGQPRAPSRPATALPARTTAT